MLPYVMNCTISSLKPLLFVFLLHWQQAKGRQTSSTDQMDREETHTLLVLVEPSLYYWTQTWRWLKLLFFNFVLVIWYDAPFYMIWCSMILLLKIFAQFLLLTTCCFEMKIKFQPNIQQYIQDTFKRLFFHEFCVDGPSRWFFLI